MRYTTIADAIEQAIVPALDEHGNDYDIDAIAREAFEYKVDTDEQGNELLNTAGFEQIVDTNGFWAIVEKHDKTDWHPGYGQDNDMAVHRTREDGRAYCGQETVTVGDRDSARDLIKNHGYRSCVYCGIAMADAGIGA